MKLAWNPVAVSYALLFLLILILAYTGNLPPQLNVIPYYDKIGHVVLYCIASYLGHQVCQRRHWHWIGRSLPLFPTLFGLFTLAEEVVQGWSPHRSLDPVDLIASVVGIGLGYRLAERDRLGGGGGQP